MMDSSDNGNGVALRPPVDPYRQAWRTAYFTSTFEKRRVTRLVLESLEVGFHLCNLYLERYGTAKLFDIVNQILPTAYIVNTGYWAFYSCRTGPSLCVCTRFGIRCPHVRNAHHWINMDAFQESEQNYIFSSQTGPFCPNDCQVEVLPVANASEDLYDIRIRMTVITEDSEAVEDQTNTLTIEARYGATVERHPAEKKFVQFYPHPLSHPYYARYFSILHSFYDTCANHDQFAQVSTLVLSGYPKFTRRSNDNGDQPTLKLPPCSTFIPNRPPFDQSVLTELSQKFSATLHYAPNRSRGGSSVSNNSNAQNAPMMRNAEYQDSPHNFPHGNAANTNVVNVHLPAVGTQCRYNHVVGGWRYYSAAQQSNCCRMPPPGYQIHAQPPMQTRGGRQRRGGRGGFGYQGNNLRGIAPAPQPGPSTFENQYFSSYNTQSQRYAQGNFQQQPQYAPPMRSTRPMQPYQQYPPSTQLADRYWAHGPTNQSEAVPRRHVTFRLDRQEQNSDDAGGSNVFEENYDREFPPLQQAPRRTSTVSARRAPQASTEGEGPSNSSLNNETNELLDDIVQVIEEDMIRCARAVGNRIARNVPNSADRPQYINVRRTTALKNESNDSTSDATCTLHSQSEHLLKIKAEPESDASDSLVLISSDED